MNTRHLAGIVFLIAIILPFVFAHEEDGKQEEGLRANSITYALTASAAILILIFMSMHGQKTNKQKAILFIIMTLIITITTGYLITATIQLNNDAVTGGPVHWHADYEIWECGSKIDLKDPEGMANRVGTAVLHEHGDDRIHVEGPVLAWNHINLEKYFAVVGVELTQEKLVVPTNDGIAELRSGELCRGERATLQAFVYKVTNPSDTRKSGFTYAQTKIDNIQEYVLSPYGQVPPGDCIIIELDVNKPSTTRICETYKNAQAKGDLTEVNHGG